MANDVEDQGCEFCESAVTDLLPTGEHAHFWVCGECWNERTRRYREEIHSAQATNEPTVIIGPKGNDE